METQIEVPPINRLVALAIEINALQDQVEYAQQSTVIYAVRCGAKLIEAKKQVAHGEWLPWLKDNCKVSQGYAYKYMQIANQYPELLNANFAPARSFNLKQAIELLSAPEELKTEVMARIENGEDITRQEIRELKKQLLSKNCELSSKDVQLQSALKMIDGYIALNKQYPTQVVEKPPVDYEQNKIALEEANNKARELETEIKRIKNKQAQLNNEEKQAHEKELAMLENRKQSIQKNIDDLLAFQKTLSMKDRIIKSRLKTYEDLKQALITFSGIIYDWTGMVDTEFETPIVNGLIRACNDCSRALNFILDNRPPASEKSAIGYERIN